MKASLGWLALLGLIVVSTAGHGAPGSASVVRDVGWVYSAPHGYEVDRLRRGERVGVLGAVDRRSQRDGAIWVHIRRPGPEGHRGWMRADDLAPSGRRAPTLEEGGLRRPLPNNEWALEAPSARTFSELEVPIVDMDFDCRKHAIGRHIGSCDLTTVVRVPGDQILRGALIARVACEVAVDWTGVSGREYRQSARASRRLPVAADAPESTLTLSYTFSEAATGALVAEQRCFAAGDNGLWQADTIIGR